MLVTVGWLVLEGMQNCGCLYIRAFGIKFGQISQAETLSGKRNWLFKRLVLPPLKFVITGTGKVGGGIKEILDHED
jgi:hypothetical protein